ncbi:lactose permease [Colletotrichum spaethianum]|uniref:Lactose permease n=1 Tax=Colletotrichum spaethianum TaxID=700344 RepID=A0AA37URB4_9PEZI|nr:lactose permease [Colletotrichum spaethianum]GKT47718.1 lactose permease [Colletotrichum spaethianum]
MNGLQTLGQWRGYFGNPSAPILGTMNALYPIGKIMGLFPTTYMADKYGRKVPMWIGFFLLLVGAALQGASTSLPMFVVSRWLLSAATAFIAQPAPILVAELAYPTMRGKISALYNTFFAREVFIRYHAGGDESSSLVDYEIKEIEENVRLEIEAVQESSYLELVKTAPNRRRTLIAFIVGVGARWSGSNPVSYFLTLVLNTVGITETKDQALINGLLQLFNWIAAVFAGAMMVDRIGRRKLFLTSTGGMLVCYIVWTILTSVFSNTKDERAGYAIVASVFVYYLFYDIAWSPPLMSYPVEIFPYTLRGRGLTVSLGSTFTSLIIGQFCNPIGLANLGWKYYIVFCVVLAILLSLIWFLFPENKGRTLEQIAEVFEGKDHILGPGDTIKEKGEGS